jgi:GSH-dependent disulfide-bond oxidoreductase
VEPPYLTRRKETSMYVIYTAPTPNGIKPTIVAAELDLPHIVKRVDLSGEQRTPSFLRINPNGRIPALVDGFADDDAPVTLFESGAIMLHLARAGSGLLGRSATAQAATLSWLFLQVAGLGPAFGNAAHFLRLGRPDLAEATRRFSNEALRHTQLLESRLAEGDWLNGESYSVADIAHFAWLHSASYAGIRLGDHPRLSAWHNRILDQPLARWRQLRSLFDLSASAATSTKARTFADARRPSVCKMWIGSGASSCSPSTVMSRPDCRSGPIW